MGEDELADSASPELASIRRHMRAAEAKVRDILQKLISSNQSKYLQEAIITIRSDRYVVPVKSEHKNAIPGLVHDVSSSGSTFFIEPMGVVKANNERRELAAKEKKEIERILAELSAQCAAHKEDILEDYQLLVWLDAIFARAKLSVKLECTQPRLSDKYLRLRGARHPLLDQKKAVANDLELGDAFDTLVITGPNTGGKTVTLKTMGLLTLMAQCGLHIPAKDDSTVRVFSRVLADIGDEQSIAQSLSTFSSHMVNIVGILKEADDSSLILFDELGAGTDPVEGAALAAAVIESARGLGALVAATTHYAELKVYAMTTPGVENASCEFNVDTLAPTYRLVLGIPGKSNAFAISRRLGLPEYIIDKAAARLDAENVRFEDVLTKLDQQRQEMERERDAARRLKLEMEQSAARAREYRQKLEEERAKVVEKAQAEARAIIDEARAASDLALSQLKELQKQKDLDWQQVNEGPVPGPAPAQPGGAEHRRPGPGAGGPAPHPGRPGGGHGGAGEDGHPGHRPVGEQGRHPPAPGGHFEDLRQAGGGPGGGGGDPEPEGGPEDHPAGRAHPPGPRRPGAGPAGHDHRRGPHHPGELPGRRHDGQAGDGDHHPRQGHRRRPRRRAELPEAQPLCEDLPPRPLRRGRRWSNGGGVEIRVWDGIKSLVPLGEQGGLRGDWSPLKARRANARARSPQGTPAPVRMGVTVAELK